MKAIKFAAIAVFFSHLAKHDQDPGSSGPVQLHRRAGSSMIFTFNTGQEKGTVDIYVDETLDSAYYLFSIPILLSFSPISHSSMR